MHTYIIISILFLAFNKRNEKELSKPTIHEVLSLIILHFRFNIKYKSTLYASSNLHKSEMLPFVE